MNTPHEGRMPTGNASTEYLLVSVLLAGILFLPLPGLELSLVELVLDALRGRSAHARELLSMP